MSLQKHSMKNNRVFQKTKGWYFATREGIDMGPFPDKKSAEYEVYFYLMSMQKLSRAS